MLKKKKRVSKQINIYPLTEYYTPIILIWSLYRHTENAYNMLNCTVWLHPYKKHKNKTVYKGIYKKQKNHVFLHQNGTFS